MLCILSCSPTSMRILIGLIYWPNVIICIPASVAGLWFGLNVIHAYDDLYVGIIICVAVILGWWLTYGYHTAFFHGITPLSWRVFWSVSIGENVVLVLLWVVSILQNSASHQQPHSHADDAISDLLSTSVFWGWPLVVTLLSAAALVKGPPSELTSNA